MTSLPWMPAGTVYGTLLNFRHERSLWTDRMNEAPYQAPPQAPVLYIKTANTFTPGGGQIALPRGVSAVDVSATLGLVAGEHGAIAGCVLFNDVAIPHESYYRPPVKYRNVDGFLGVGLELVSWAAAGGRDGVRQMSLDLHINGVLQQTVSIADAFRDAVTLWADVNRFQSLRPGDVLMMGTECLTDGRRPQARAGDVAAITAPGFAALINTFVEEAA